MANENNPSIADAQPEVFAAALDQIVMDEDVREEIDADPETALGKLGLATKGLKVKTAVRAGKSDPPPTFAPPYVPVGPVVMGDNIATPGH